MLSAIAPAIGTVFVAVLAFITGRLNNADPRKALERDIEMLLKLEKLKSTTDSAVTSRAIVQLHLEEALKQFWAEQQTLRDFRPYVGGLISLCASLLLLLVSLIAKDIFTLNDPAKKLVELGIRCSIGGLVGVLIAAIGIVLYQIRHRRAKKSEQAAKDQEKADDSETADDAATDDDDTARK
jgi:hypothetical protein